MKSRPLIHRAALIAMFFAAALAPHAARALSDPIEIKTGRISGIAVAPAAGAIAEVRAYKGIPFAAPPVGDLRWRAPQPPAPWQGIRRCDSFGPICSQEAYPQGSIYSRPPEPQGEDCLYLNLWTGADAASERRPVMVWIHGGALTRGSGSTSTYDGATLARKGAVVVTINYRLNVFGFLAHPELTAESDRKSSGNYGLLDQIAALQWVKDNVAAFGGDPNRVTIFGESAGSFSVNALMASAPARGLFHRAIGQSGAMFRPGTYLNKDFDGRPSAESSGKAFLEALGAPSIKDARRLSSAALVDAMAGPGKSFPSRPCVDGWVLADEIRNVFARGEQADVPVIVGSNADEMTTLSPPGSIPKNLEALEKTAKLLYKDRYDDFRRLYPAATDAEAARAFLDAARDSAFTQPMRAWAREMSRVKSPAYLYYFTHVPPLPNRAQLRAFHAAEIAYVFGNVDKSERPFEPGDMTLSEKMSAYWLNFAATGNPNGAGLPTWDPYNADAQPYMEFADRPEPKHKLMPERLDFMESLPQK